MTALDKTNQLNINIIFLSGVLGLCFFCLGCIVLSYPEVFQVSEAREGVVVERMLQTNEFILPLRHGEIIPSKPILFHWLSGLSSTITIKYNAFNLRIPSLISASLFLVVFSLFCAKISSNSTGLLSAIFLASSYGFIRLAGDGRVDMLFNFFMTVGICAGYLTISSNKIGFALISGCFVGLAVLTKGPLGAALPIAILTITFLATKRAPNAKQIKLFCITAFAISAPWYIAAVKVGGMEFIQKQLYFENLSRITGGSGITRKPAWFYLEHLFTQAAPCSTIFCLGSIVAYFLWGKKRQSFYSNSIITKLKNSSPLLKFGLIWFFTVLVIISFSAGKRRAYLMSALPGLCMIWAISAEHLLNKLQRSLRIGKTPVKLIVATSFSWLVIATTIIGFRSLSIFDHPLLSIPKLQEAELGLQYAISTAPFLWVIALFSLVGFGVFILLISIYHKSAYLLCFSIILACFTALYGGIPLGLAIKGYTHSYANFAEKIKKHVGENDNLSIVKTHRDESFDGLFFYLNRHIQIASTKEIPRQTNTYYLARVSWMEKQSPETLNNIQILTTGGRVTDTKDEKLALFIVSR